MIEAVAAIGHLPTAMPGQPEAVPADVALKQPTEAEAADFARTVRGAAPLETSAAAPPPGETLSARLAAQADRLSAHLQALGPANADGAPRPAASDGHPLADARGQMADAVGQIERAYMFAIETTMASRGSTETTKIFNTLLKGQ